MTENTTAAQPSAAAPPRVGGPMFPVLRTFVLATIAVPIYGLMPQLHKLRGRMVSRSARR